MFSLKNLARKGLTNDKQDFKKMPYVVAKSGFLLYCTKNNFLVRIEISMKGIKFL